MSNGGVGIGSCRRFGRYWARRSDDMVLSVGEKPEGIEDRSQSIGNAKKEKEIEIEEESI